MNKEELKKGKCYFCGKDCDGDAYCYGCQEFVCMECDERGLETPFGQHSVDEHKE